MSERAQLAPSSACAGRLCSDCGEAASELLWCDHCGAALCFECDGHCHHAKSSRSSHQRVLLSSVTALPPSSPQAGNQRRRRGERHTRDPGIGPGASQPPSSSSHSGAGGSHHPADRNGGFDLPEKSRRKIYKEKETILSLSPTKSLGEPRGGGPLARLGGDGCVCSRLGLYPTSTPFPDSPTSCCLAGPGAYSFHELDTSSSSEVRSPSCKLRTGTLRANWRPKKSALRGGHEGTGLGPRRKLSVRWHPEVSDPVCTTVSHTLGPGHRLPLYVARRGYPKHLRHKTKTSPHSGKKPGSAHKLRKQIDPLVCRLHPLPGLYKAAKRLVYCDTAMLKVPPPSPDEGGSEDAGGCSSSPMDSQTGPEEPGPAKAPHTGKTLNSSPESAPETDLITTTAEIHKSYSTEKPPDATAHDRPINLQEFDTADSTDLAPKNDTRESPDVVDVSTSSIAPAPGADPAGLGPRRYPGDGFQDRGELRCEEDDAEPGGGGRGSPPGAEVPNPAPPPPQDPGNLGDSKESLEVDESFALGFPESCRKAVACMLHAAKLSAQGNSSGAMVEYEAAARLFREAEKNAALPDARDVAKQAVQGQVTAWISVAALYSQKGQICRAEQCHLLVLRACQASGLKLDAGKCLLEAGKCQLRRGECKRAHALFSAATLLFEDCGEGREGKGREGDAELQELVLKAGRLAGAAALQGRDVDVGKKLLLGALVAARRLHFKAEEARCLRLLANLQRGEPHLKSLQAAVDSFSVCDLPYEHAEALFCLATLKTKLHVNGGRSEEKRPPSPAAALPRGDQRRALVDSAKHDLEAAAKLLLQGGGGDQPAVLATHKNARAPNTAPESNTPIPESSAQAGRAPAAKRPSVKLCVEECGTLCNGPVALQLLGRVHEAWARACVLTGEVQGARTHLALALGNREWVSACADEALQAQALLDGLQSHEPGNCRKSWRLHGGSVAV